MKITKAELKQIIKEELSKVLPRNMREQLAHPKTTGNYVPPEPTKRADGTWEILWRAPGADEEFVTTLKLVGADADANPPATEVHMEINGQKEEFMAENPRELLDGVVHYIGSEGYSDTPKFPHDNYWFIGAQGQGKDAALFIKQIERVIGAMAKDVAFRDEDEVQRWRIAGERPTPFME